MQSYEVKNECDECNMLWRVYCVVTFLGQLFLRKGY